MGNTSTVFLGVPTQHKNSEIYLLYRKIDRRGCTSKCTLNYCISAPRTVIHEKQSYFVFPLCLSWKLDSITKYLNVLANYGAVRLPYQYFSWFPRLHDPYM